MNKLRTLVSGKKQRYIDEKFNLDLTYVTPRIIAMAFPGTGIKTLYRNNLNTVAKFLTEKHGGNFLIFNLSGEKYDVDKFEGKVIEYDNWLDHHSPPLNLLFVCVEQIHNFLKKDDKNVIVINCNAGKGRTGTLICCYLLFSGRFNNPDDAFDYYSLKRFFKGNGVTHASQKRYVKYFFDIITKQHTFHFPIVRQIVKIEINRPPYNNIKSINPSYKIFRKDVQIKREPVQNEISNVDLIVSQGKNIIFSEPSLKVSIFGDCLIKLKHAKILGKISFGRVAFNTAFIDPNATELVFELNDIDPYHFSVDKKVDPFYKMIFTLFKDCNCDNTKSDALCERCNALLKDDVEKFKEINRIRDLYEADVEKSKVLLFGDSKNDDVEEVFKHRNELKSPQFDRRLNSDKEKYDENCHTF